MGNQYFSFYGERRCGPPPTWWPRRLPWRRTWVMSCSLTDADDAADWLDTALRRREKPGNNEAPPRVAYWRGGKRLGVAYRPAQLYRRLRWRR